MEKNKLLQLTDFLYVTITWIGMILRNKNSNMTWITDDLLQAGVKKD